MEPPLIKKYLLIHQPLYLKEERIMAHNITATDGAVFHREKAWHGLGIVIQEEMTPQQAMEISGLGWTVSKSDSVNATVKDSEVVSSKDYNAVIRDDTKTILSIQSPNYKIVQNSEVFDLAYSLDKEIKVESALSMNEGRRLVVLCKSGEMQAANGNDVLNKYMALVNSHDGTIALSALPTSVRIVCQNTLSMAMAQGGKKAFRVVHSGDMNKKREAMQEALKLYAHTGVLFQKRVDALVQKELTKDEIQKFWMEVWANIEEPISANPQNSAEMENRENALESIARWSMIFDKERETLHAGASLWLAANAVTNDIQHKIASRGRKSTFDSAAYSNLMGTNCDRTIEVMKFAFASLAA